MNYEGKIYLDVILLGSKKTKFSSNFRSNNLDEKKLWEFFHFFKVCYLYGEYFNSCKNFHGRLKACVKFIREKINLYGFLETIFIQWLKFDEKNMSKIRCFVTKKHYDVFSHTEIVFNDKTRFSRNLTLSSLPM